MRTLGRVSVVFCAAALLGAPLAATAHAYTAADTITRWNVGTWTIWRIDRPNVRERMTEYPDIRFRPGDRVLIDAGGCVQTGDAGRRLYVDPQGPDSDRFYHGLAWIPGATDGPVRLGSVLRQEIRIPESADPAELHLRLGYEDRSFGDNGFGGRSRPGDQCAGQPDAYVFVGAQHQLEPNLSLPRPMDLVWGSRDVNYFPKNPMWGLQQTNPGSVPDPRPICFSVPGWFDNPICTVQRPYLDTAWGITGWICSIGSTTPIAGHVDWYPSTYDGPIYWSGQSTFDRDYNMSLVPPNKNGLTVPSGTTLHGEFDARETINYFGTPWWVAFRNASDSTKNSMVNGRQAIVGALMGLDCEHDCIAELHPVWLIAIHVKDDPLDDVWAIFMRNWGNEGFCSRYDHQLILNNNYFTVTLPWRGGASSVGLTAGTQFLSNNSSIRGWWSGVPYQKVSLTFALPPPGDHGRVHGELHLRWSGASVAAAAEAELAEAILQAPETGEKGGEAEDLLDDLVQGMAPEQREAFEKEIAAAPRAPDAVPMPFKVGAPPRAGRAPAGTPRVRLVADPATAAANAQVIEALRKAYGGRIPGIIGDAIEEFERVQEERRKQSEPDR